MNSILPIFLELSAILQRIFESHPRYRVTLDEPHNPIIACPRFTYTYYNNPTPNPPASYEYVDAMVRANMTLPPSPHQCSPHRTGFHGQSSEWLLFEPASKQSSSYSCGSNDKPETYQPEPGHQQLNLFNLMKVSSRCRGPRRWHTTTSNFRRHADDEGCSASDHISEARRIVRSRNLLQWGAWSVAIRQGSILSEVLRAVY